MLRLFTTDIGRLRLLGWAEACSFIALLAVGMPLKYAMELPGPNRVLGMVHGLVFVLYAVLAVQVQASGQLPKGTFWKLLGYSLLPLGPFIADRKHLRG